MSGYTHEAMRSCNVFRLPSEALKKARDKLAIMFGNKHVFVKAHLEFIT